MLGIREIARQIGLSPATVSEAAARYASRHNLRVARDERGRIVGLDPGDFMRLAGDQRTPLPAGMVRVKDAAEALGVSSAVVSEKVARYVERHDLRVVRDARSRVVGLDLEMFKRLAASAPRLPPRKIELTCVGCEEAFQAPSNGPRPSRCCACRAPEKLPASTACLDCGAAVVGRAVRCGDCRADLARRRNRRWYAANPRPPSPCKGCGAAIEKGRQKCDACRDAAADAKRARDADRRRAKATRRRRPNGSPPLARDKEKRKLEEVRRTAKRAEREGRSYLSRADLAARSLERRQARAVQIATERAARSERRAAQAAERIAAKPWSAPGLSGREKFVLRYRLDPEFAIKQRMRAAFRRRRQGLRIGDILRAAVKRNGRAPSVEAFVGYTAQDLRRHLERQFLPGMTWAAFCDGRIHIDHILPLSSFRIEDPEELRAAWALSNLRPLWEAANIAKAAQVQFLL